MATIPPNMAAFIEKLSPRAQKAIAHWDWTIHQSERCSREELSARLADKGVIEWPFLWPLEEAFAGTSVRVGGDDLEIGICKKLPNFEAEELTNGGNDVVFVPIGFWGIFTVFAEKTGKLFLFHEPDELVPLEPSFEALLEHRAMLHSLSEWAPKARLLEIRPSGVGALIAKHKNIPAVIEVTNEQHEWWQNESWTVLSAKGNANCSVWATELSGLVSAMDCAAQLSPEVMFLPRPSYEKGSASIVSKEECAAQAPSIETVRSRPFARRYGLLTAPSIYKGKAQSRGDIWVTGDGATLQVSAFEYREGELLNYWALTPEGSTALLTSPYGRT